HDDSYRLRGHLTGSTDSRIGEAKRFGGQPAVLDLLDVLYAAGAPRVADSVTRQGERVVGIARPRQDVTGEHGDGPEGFVTHQDENDFRIHLSDSFPLRWLRNLQDLLPPAGLNDRQRRIDWRAAVLVDNVGERFLAGDGTSV